MALRLCKSIQFRDKMYVWEQEWLHHSVYYHAKKNNMSLIPPGNVWNLLTNILNQSQPCNILFYSHNTERRIKTCTISGLKNPSGRDGISWNLLKFRAPVFVNSLRPNDAYMRR